MTAQIVNGYYYATGRRKASSARVFMKEGTGKVTVNKRSLEDFFGKDTIWLAQALKPLKILHQDGMFDLVVTVKGGGVNGQSGAVSLGIARALDLFAKKNSPQILEEDDSEVSAEAEATDDESTTESEGPLGVEKWHNIIRKAGLLTRDSRRVLRKKVGLVKARKAKQFSKR